MKVPISLSKAFGKEFQDLISQFAFDHKLIPSPEEILSPRFIARSIVPHVNKLSSLFNRNLAASPPKSPKDQSGGLSPYWKESSNPAHLRLAYFLYFMPCNLYRTAAIWAELARLGYRWPFQTIRGIEFGAGPASGACGIAAGERHVKIGLPTDGMWALIEQDRAILELGTQWAQTYFAFSEKPNWEVRPFHRKTEPKAGFLPRSAPKFNLWLMSFYLNELNFDPHSLAASLLQDWEQHLEEEGLVILVEPALKQQSRRLLELRKALIQQIESPWITPGDKSRRRAKGTDGDRSTFQILLPCLGHQACGALAAPEDWCHEEVSWWRPPYFRGIDQMAKLDRKTLPFSYLVITRSKRPREEILPELKKAGVLSKTRIHRLVSPAHSEGRELEFFTCGSEGKRKARYRPQSESDPAKDLGRGDILLEAKIRGDENASRIDSIEQVI